MSILQIRSIEDYCVPDLQGANTKWTFILESPHNSEIELGYPAAGESGKIMSEVLLGTKQPIGQLLHEKNPIVAGYSVMNASCIPLQNICYQESDLHQKMEEISNARRHTKQGIVEAKMVVKRALDSSIGNRITQHLQRRLMRHLKLHPNGVFIVCGVVAQSIFEVATSAEGWFHKARVISLEGMKTTVFYENHPSEQSGAQGSRWRDKENMKPLLQLLGR